MYYYYENPDYEANPLSRSFIKVLSITENIFTALVIGVLSMKRFVKCILELLTQKEG